MSLLKPATNKMAFAKVGIYGTAGSGKTRTATEIAIGLHKAIGSKKPVVAFDTEPAFSFVLPIFQKAGIELLVADESRALADLMAFMDEFDFVVEVVGENAKRCRNIVKAQMREATEERGVEW